MLQNLNQSDTRIYVENFSLEINQMILSASKTKQVARSEISIFNPFIFRVLTDRQKRAFISAVISFTENLIHNSANSLSFEKHCNGLYLILLNRDIMIPINLFIHSKTYESPFAVVFNSVKDNTKDFFTKAITPRDNFLKIQDVFVQFLKKTKRS